MEKYNYFEAVKEDVLQYIKTNINFADFDDLDELEERLNEDLWACDSITGNESSSYTCNAYKAEEYIAHNLDLLADALTEFDYGASAIKRGAECCDVIIRIYVLPRVIAEVMQEIEDEFIEAHDVA